MTVMKAVISYGPARPLVVEDRPVPDIGPGDVLVRIERCGICGSDLHAYDFAGVSSGTGSILGHEIAGTIAAMGSDVSGFSLGQRIGVYTATGCGTCAACLRGNITLCPSAQWVSGGYAEYIRVPASAAIALPEGISAAQAALIEPLTVGLYGLRTAGLVAGERVLVQGAGSIGLAAIWWARRLGAGRIVALSRSERRAEMARAMGADAFVTSGTDEVARVREALGGAPDLVAECVGATGMLGQAIEHAGLFGRVSSLGLGASPDPVVPVIAGMKGVTLYFPVGYAMDDFRETAHAIMDAPIDPLPMISSVIPLTDVPDRFAQLGGTHGETKVHIAP